MSPNDRLDSSTVMALDEPAQPAGSSAFPTAWAEVHAQADAALLQPALQGNGFTYRHDWGARRGQVVLRLNWGDVTPRSRVFVSVAEGLSGGPETGKFIGAARYTVHNVAPRAGGVDIWVNIEWSTDLLLYADYLVVNPADVTTRTVQVTVHRHSSVPLSDAEADRILADMGTILQSDDSPADVATPVRFVRNGAVRVLPPTVAGTIQTQAEWTTLMTAGTGIKVVQAIRWCGGPGDSIIGCAPVGSPSVNLAVVRFTPGQEGILWAHEYGHNAGNGHRTDDPRALMYPAIGPDHNVVNNAEAERFLSGPTAATGKVLPASGCCCDGEAIQPPRDVRDFVSLHWIEGVPYEAASRYTEDDARRLLAWLVDEPEQHEEFLPQIVSTLCFIGSEVAVQPLIDFVRSPRSGRAVFNAKNAALVRLGDLVNKSGSRAALDFLAGVAAGMDAAKALAAPQASAAKAEAAAAGVTAPGIDALGAELAVSATFGLSLAGTPEAEQAIERLIDDPDAFASVNQAAVEAAEICRTVRARGQREYYRMKAEHRNHL
ncbi:hypothetical protein [Massilia consociata]|uniref:Peptidase M60 domain-containing protein n=1 Tax=Massilia consociata TaxID=760117 RepID=A0ABV6FAP0_9BURK